MPTNPFRPLSTGATELALGGTLDYRTYWLTRSAADALHDEVRALADFRVEQTFNYGRWVDQPRRTAWFGRWYLASSKYSRYTEAPAPGPCLAALAERVASEWQFVTNAVLVNRYGPGDSVAYHADHEKLLAPAPIVSILLAAERTFRIRPAGKDTAARLASGGEHLTARLQHGDVVVMSHSMQQHYLHEVPAFKSDVGERLNLTFRQYTGGQHVPAPW